MVENSFCLYLVDFVEGEMGSVFNIDSILFTKLNGIECIFLYLV